MDLLERLRPRWRHPDPEVRAAAAREMGKDEQDRLGALASSDPDPRVRRVAIKRLEDAVALERLATSEPDRALRDLAAARARELLVRLASSDGPLPECESALARLDDAPSLAAVAIAAAHASVRADALARTSGDRALREVVKSAADPAIRRAALDRIRDLATLRSIAGGDYPHDLALEALHRIEDPAALHAIAESHTAAKSVRQRARELLGATPRERPALSAREGRARQLELCTAVQALRNVRDVLRAADQVREAQREWHALARDVEPRADVAEDFQRACEAVLEAAGSAQRRQTEAERARAVLEEGLAARKALCERIEMLEGAEAPPGIAEARAAWSRLPPIADAQDADLGRRFARACESCSARYERWRTQATRHGELERIVEAAEALADSASPPPAKQWQEVERRWRATGGTDAGNVALERRFAAIRERVQQRWHAQEHDRSARERANLKRLETLCSRAEEMLKAETLKLATGRRELAALDAALRDPGPLPAAERRATWSTRLTELRDRLMQRIATDEETERWRRWANVGAQEDIIARVEALLTTDDLAEASRRLFQLQEEWAGVATVTPDKSQALWERFRSARDELRRRCDAYFASNLEAKRALCAQVAALGDSTSWNETAELIKRLQAEWSRIGPVPPKHAAGLWREFRAPCDRFFARRKEHFARRDEEREENARKKTSLCEQAEALADSTDWETTSNALKQLQAEWKRSGAPPREQADLLWQRFRAACDRFFERKSRRGDLALEEMRQRAEGICDQLETLATTLEQGPSSADDGVGGRVDAAWGEWLRLDPAVLEPLTERFRAACERIVARQPDCLAGTRLDPASTRKRREKLCARLEELLPPAAETPREASVRDLALALRERLAANTIAGAAAKAGPRRRDLAREIERIGTSWAHLGPVLDDEARALAERFERARARLRDGAG